MAGGAKVVERAKDVVVVAGREGEVEEFLADRLASGEAAEEVAVQKVGFATMTGG